MPYQNEFARGDSLSRLEENLSVKEFNGIIRRTESQRPHELPAQLDPQRNSGNIRRIIAIDGSTVTHQVQNGYPGAEAALLNLAAIVIKLKELRAIPSRNYIPSPREIRDLEQCRTLSAILPGCNIVRRGEPKDSPKRFFRATLRKELEAKLDPDHETLLETLRFITSGRENRINCPIDDCPLEGAKKFLTLRPDVTACNCQQNENIYETDALRTHERFEESGSSEQAFTAVRQVIEHLVLVNILRYFEQTDSLDVFRDTAFVMDGPLAIFGMPAWLKSHIEKEVARLHEKSQQQGGLGILLVGIEKSGQFLDHFEELDWKEGAGWRQRLPNSTAFAPDLNYIHKHIVLRPEDAKPYGQATYYGRKILYKNVSGDHSVVMTPIVNGDGRDPHCVAETAYPRIGEALDIMDELSTYLYRDGFAPLVRAHAHAAIPLRAGTRILAEIFSKR